MSFAILFANNPRPQYYRADSAMEAVLIARKLDPSLGRVRAVALNISPYWSL